MKPLKPYTTKLTNDWIRSAVNVLYRKTSSRKIHKNELIAVMETLGSVIESNALVGVVHACEEIHNRHAQSNYDTADEMLGDLQVMLVDAMNKINKNQGNPKTINLEDLLHN